MLFEKMSELCKVNGITFCRLEKELGFANGSISKWRSAYPSADRLKKVADYFNVTTDELLSRATVKFSDDGKQIAALYDSMPRDKQDLIKCYISVIKAN